MRLFFDYHHGGLARAISQTFAGRLGHTVIFPSDEIVTDYVTARGDGEHVGWAPELFQGIHLFPWNHHEWAHRVKVWGRDELVREGFDVAFVTYHGDPGFTPWVRDLAAPNSKLVGLGGNAGGVFDAPNFLTTDKAAYDLTPDTVHKQMFEQELCVNYGAYYAPILPHHARNIGNQVHGYMHQVAGDVIQDTLMTGYCPHCRDAIPVQRPVTDYVGIWEGLQAHMPDYNFQLYGHLSEDHGGIMCYREAHLLYETHRMATFLHYKPQEGWGHCPLQMVACGRPPIVAEGFFRYRQAGKYLIPEVTCFEADRSDPAKIADRIRELTSDPRRWAQLSRRCYDVAQELMDWDLEAARVQTFLERLV